MQHFATGGNLGHLTDTNVPGTKGLTGWDPKTLTTPGTSFLARDRVSVHLPIYMNFRIVELQVSNKNDL